MEFLTHRERHEFVPSRMKIDAVDAVSPAVVRFQLRRIAVGLTRQLEDMCGADCAPTARSGAWPRQRKGRKCGQNRIAGIGS